MRPYLLTLRADLPNPAVPHPIWKTSGIAARRTGEEDEDGDAADVGDEDGDEDAGDDEYDEDDDVEDDFIEIEDDEVDGGDGRMPEQSAVLPLQPRRQRKRKPRSADHW
ncbi:MAG: hypothetical protein R2911_09570 [Caldilineaceae bacterium]